VALMLFFKFREDPSGKTADQYNTFAASRMDGNGRPRDFESNVVRD
jgi:hypothetical protein